MIKFLKKEDSDRIADRTIEIRFQSLIENTQEGTGLIGPDGKLVYLTPSVNIVLGYQVDELLDLDPVSLIHDDDRESFLFLMKDLIHWPGEGRRITCRMMHKNGNWRTLQAYITNKIHDRTVGAIIFSYEDITERLATEQKIKTSEKLYRSLFHKSPLPKWICDRKTLRYLDVNDKAIAHYGYSRKEFLQMTVFNLRPDNFHEDLELLMKTGQCAEFCNKQLQHIRKNGDLIFVEVSIHPVVYDQTDAFLIIAHDISESVQLQKDLFRERLYKQVEIAQATIAAQEREREQVGRELHENVNQMLASIRLHLNAFTSGGMRDEHLIEKSTKIIDDSIDALRQISKVLAPPSLENFTLKESLEDLTQGLPVPAGSIRFSYRGIKEETLSEALKITIYRIVQLQVANISQHSRATVVAVSLFQSAHSLKLRIADNGVGFDTSINTEGKGIAGIIHRSIAFDGKVQVESSPGKGCSVSVTFRLK